MATVTVTYNGQALPTQVRKLQYSRTEKEMQFSGVFAADPSNVAALLEALRVDDATLVIGGGSYAETFEMNSGSNTQCTAIRTNVEKLNEVKGGESLALIQFTVNAKLQTKWSSGFRVVNYSWNENDQGIYQLTVDGEVTGSGATTAKARFDSGIATVENVGKALLGDADNGNLSNTLFDEPQTFIQIDRHNGDLRFTRTFQELAHPANEYTGSDARDSTIVFPTFRITRVKTLRRGIDVPHLTKYRVTWSARLNKSKDPAAFIAQHDGTIRALIINRIKSIFTEADTMVLESDEIDYARSGQTASAVWEVSSNDTTVSFSEVLEASVIVANSDKVLDEQDFTEAPYSAGARLELTQRIKHVTRGTPPPTPNAPIVAFNGKQLETYLKEFTPSEGNETVGEATGANGELTGTALEYTLDWRAVYKAYATPQVDQFRKTVSGGKQMNVRGKVQSPIG